MLEVILYKKNLNFIIIIIILDANKKNLQISIFENLINQIKKKLNSNYDNYSFEIKYDSIVLIINNIKTSQIFILQGNEQTEENKTIYHIF